MDSYISQRNVLSKKEWITIGENRFSKKGIRLEVHTPELEVQGRIGFGVLTQLKYDIMGPFKFIPFAGMHFSGTIAIVSYKGKEYNW